MIVERDAPGGEEAPRSGCADVRKPSVESVNETIADSDCVPTLARPWGRPEPGWHKFVNVTADARRQAAVLLQHLAKNHPLPDANKRAAFLLTARVLDANGLRWGPSDVKTDTPA